MSIFTPSIFGFCLSFVVLVVRSLLVLSLVSCRCVLFWFVFHCFEIWTRVGRSSHHQSLVFVFPLSFLFVFCILALFILAFCPFCLYFLLLASDRCHLVFVLFSLLLLFGLLLPVINMGQCRYPRNLFLFVVVLLSCPFLYSMGEETLLLTLIHKKHGGRKGNIEA